MNNESSTIVSLKAEIVRLKEDRDDALAEIDRLQKGGCARDQKTTQFCAEAVSAIRERDEARELAQQMSESNQVLQAEVREYRKKAESVPVSSNETNLKLVLEEVANLAKALKEERDEARGEAVRYRSLYYQTLNIDRSASWFPWEAKNE
jgi:transcription initiation factor TFIIIB Brf1 subunit/transcription initiation factor TFIIB